MKYNNQIKEGTTCYFASNLHVGDSKGIQSTDCTVRKGLYANTIVPCSSTAVCESIKKIAVSTCVTVTGVVVCSFEAITAQASAACVTDTVLYSNKQCFTGSNCASEILLRLLMF